MTGKQSSQQAYEITVIGRHVEVTDAMKDYAREKVAKIEKISDRIIEAMVVMDIQKLEHRVEIILKVGHTKITVSAASHDMYASIDKAADRLQRKLRRYRSRLIDHHARSLSMTDMTVNVYQVPVDDTVDINDEIEEENLRQMEASYTLPKVVKKKSRALKTLTLHEALMKVDLSGDNFLVYRSEEDRKLKVIYRRRDESFGVIEPE